MATWQQNSNRLHWRDRGTGTLQGKPNVVYIIVDSLRPDHLGCYGYGKNTSPHIDAIAAEGIRFERAFSPGIPTMPSFTTTLTGLHPYKHGITAHSSSQRLGRDVVMLPQMFQAAGYTTIGIDNLAVQGTGRGSWFPRGFDYYSSYLFKPFSDQSAHLVTRAETFIDDFHEEPFLLFMHLWDPHTPYGPPKPFDTLHYSEEPEAGEPSMAEVKALAPEYYEAFMDDMRLQVPDDYGYVVAQYDGEISYVDSQIGRVVEHLKTKGIWENTILIVQSDHGECFGEGGLYFDHHGLYDAVVRVALVVRGPGIAASTSQAMISTEDMVPTLATILDLELPHYPLTGQSFAGVLTGQETEARDHVVCVESSRQASICLRTEEWKLIQPIVLDAGGNSLPDFYGNERSSAPQLFHLSSDPGEVQDVADQFPEVRDSLCAKLSNWRAEAVAHFGSDPLLAGLSLPYSDFMGRLSARKLRG